MHNLVSNLTVLTSACFACSLSVSRTSAACIVCYFYLSAHLLLIGNCWNLCLITIRVWEPRIGTAQWNRMRSPQGFYLLCFYTLCVVENSVLKDGKNKMKYLNEALHQTLTYGISASHLWSQLLNQSPSQVNVAQVMRLSFSSHELKSSPVLFVDDLCLCWLKKYKMNLGNRISEVAILSSTNTMPLHLPVMKSTSAGSSVSSAVIAGTLEMDSLYAFTVLSVLSANNDSMLCGLPQAVLLTHQVECY